MNDPRPFAFASSVIFFGAALWFFSRRASANELPDGAAGSDAQPLALPDFTSTISDALAGLAYRAETTVSDVVDSMSAPSNADSNVAAFLATIRKAEGTSGPNGYRTLVGGGLFDGYADHPRIAVQINSNGQRITSTAAGAYQILSRTWDDLRRSGVDLQDFSPANQDKAAIALIRRRGALSDVRNGAFASAVSKVRQEWASMPGAGYGQPEKTLVALQSAYLSAGGVVA